MTASVALHVSAHPDDEALGAPGVLQLLRRAGWTVVNFVQSLGRPADQERRKAEAQQAARLAGFEVRFAEPPIRLSSNDDLAAASRQLAQELVRVMAHVRPAVVVSPSPHDRHHGHEAVGRAVQSALSAGRPGQLWWMWGMWADLPFPNLYVPLTQVDMDRVLACLDSYQGELRRNDYRRYLAGRDAANVALGSERVFGFGADRASDAPYAELLTAVRFREGRWLAPPPALLTGAPPDQLPAVRGLDLTPWITAPSVRELVLGPRSQVQ